MRKQLTKEELELLLLKSVRDLVRELKRQRKRDAEIFDDEEDD